MLYFRFKFLCIQNFIIMKKIGYVLWMFLCFGALAQSNSPLKVSGNVQFTNNGVSPIPAFSLDRPAVLGSYKIEKGRFFYQQLLNYGLDTKPWDNVSRFGYRLFDNDKWNVTAASFFAIYTAARDVMYNNEEFQIQRYQDYELYITRKLNPTSDLTLMYWNEHALDKVGVQHSDIAMATYSNIQLPVFSNSMVMTLAVSLLYISNTSDYKGLLSTQNITLRPKN